MPFTMIVYIFWQYLCTCLFGWTAFPFKILVKNDKWFQHFWNSVIKKSGQEFKISAKNLIKQKIPATSLYLLSWISDSINSVKQTSPSCPLFTIDFCKYDLVVFFCVTILYSCRFSFSWTDDIARIFYKWILFISCLLLWENIESPDCLSWQDSCGTLLLGPLDDDDSNSSSWS